MSTIRPAHGGFALLEVLVALTILSTAGLAIIEGVRSTLLQTARVTHMETEMVDKARLLGAYTLLTEADLRHRIGRRRVGAYTVDVDALALDVFLTTIRSEASPDLVTIVYPANPNAQ